MLWKERSLILYIGINRDKNQNILMIICRCKKVSGGVKFPKDFIFIPEGRFSLFITSISTKSTLDPNYMRLGSFSVQ